MATPIKATPVVKGKVAKDIAREIREGTPNTTHRVTTIKRADNVFRSAFQPKVSKK